MAILSTTMHHEGSSPHNVPTSDGLAEFWDDSASGGDELPDDQSPFRCFSGCEELSRAGFLSRSPERSRNLLASASVRTLIDFDACNRPLGECPPWPSPSRALDEVFSSSPPENRHLRPPGNDELELVSLDGWSDVCFSDVLRCAWPEAPDEAAACGPLAADAVRPCSVAPWPLAVATVGALEVLAVRRLRCRAFAVWQHALSCSRADRDAERLQQENAKLRLKIRRVVGLIQR
mmetsp:Transcript_50012/g.143788  ORF Transcript_50012/g.143788 Transcript_50012/m.143788 type:complete len:234 (+) Transcript_50012:68-769(+)